MPWWRKLLVRILICLGVYTRHQYTSVSHEEHCWSLSSYYWIKAVLTVVDDASFFPHLIDYGEKT